MRKVLLDTSAFIELLRGEKQIADIINSADIVNLSIFVIGELLVGFRGGKKEKENFEIYNSFKNMPTVRVLDGTEETAEIFSEIKSNLKEFGKPIPINDIWIASHCIETGSVLVTCDKHFNSIQGLRLIQI